MARKVKFFAVIGLSGLVGACSFVEEGLWPILGDNPEPLRTARLEREKTGKFSVKVPQDQLATEPSSLG